MRLDAISIKDFGWRAFITFMMICPLYYNHLQVHGWQTMRLAHEQMFQLGVTVLFAICFLRNLWLAVFLVWSCFLYAYYNFPSIGGNLVSNIFWACILYEITYRYVTHERVKQLFIAVLVLVAIHLVFLSIQLLGYDPLFTNLSEGNMNTSAVGIMGLKAMSGMFLAIATPIAMFFFPFLAVVLVPFIAISECSVAVIAFSSVVLFKAWFVSRKVFLIILIPIMAAGAIYIANDSKANMMTDRFSMWKMAAKDAFTRPIVGMGLDSFRNIGQTKPFMYFKNTKTNEAVKMKYVGGDNPWVAQNGYKLDYVEYEKDGQILRKAALDPWDHPHNEYVSLFYEFGIVGFLIICALLWDIVRRFQPEPLLIVLFSIFIVYLILSVGQFPFHMARTAHFSVIFLAAYYKLTDKGVIYAQEED